MYCCCSARKSGSLISAGDTTWANAVPVMIGMKVIRLKAIRLISTRLGPSPPALLLGIHHSGSMIGRIGDQADVSNQPLDLCLAESIAVRRHQCGLAERGPTVTDNRGQVGIAHFIERVAFHKRMWLDLKIIVIGNPLR